MIQKNSFISSLNDFSHYFIIGMAASPVRFCYSIKKISSAIFESLTSDKQLPCLKNKKLVSGFKHLGRSFIEIIPIFGSIAAFVIDKKKAEKKVLKVIEDPWYGISKALCAKGLPQDLFDPSLYSPLQAAVLLEDIKLCKIMVDLGFSINSPEKGFKQPVLALALGQASKEISNDLANKSFQVNSCVQDYSAQKNDVSEEIISYLIEKGADLTYEDKNGNSYLHIAVRLGFDKICKILLEKGFDVNKLAHERRHFYNPNDLVDISPLLIAVRCKHTAVIRLLLEHGADFKSPQINFSDYNYNPFYLALKNGTEEIIQLFLDNGAQLDQEIDWICGKTALLDALSKKNLFELALKRGINLERKFGNSQDTYLHKAALSGNKDVCELLIKAGANIHALDIRNNTILHNAAHKKNEDITSLLLENGANARVLNIDAKTPLMFFQEKTNFSQDYSKKTHAVLEKADEGLTPLMRSLRLLGLRFSLEGAAFEGSLKEETFDEVASSLKEYLKKHSDLPRFFYMLPKIIQKATTITSQDVLSQLEKNGIIPLFSGWHQHATSIVLTKNFLIKCNRGGGCGEEPGMKIYKINKPSNLSQALNNLFSNLQTNEESIFPERSEKEHVEFFNKGINDVLDLEQLTYIHQKEQTAGNCGWLAAKMALRGCVLAYYMEKKLKQNSPLEMENILHSTQTFMSSWKEFDYLRALDVLEQVEAEPLVKGFIDMEKVYDELFSKSTHKVKVLEKLTSLHVPPLQETHSH